MEQSQAYVSDYLQAAGEALQEANVLYERGLLKGTVSRAYYAMFYAACAALIVEQVNLPRRHATIINLFYRYLVQSDMVERHFHRDLARAFQLRQQSDYEIGVQLGDDKVREVVGGATAFVAEVHRLVATR